MTDSTPPPPVETPATPAAPPPRRYRGERILVGILFFALTGGVIVNGAVRIWKDTYRPPVTAPPYATCSEGVRRTYDAFFVLLATSQATPAGFAPQRPTTDPAVQRAVHALDVALLAMRPVCEREGPAALDAFEAMTSWRHHAEDVARLGERVLTSDAERALRYHSSGDVSPTVGTHR